jgi:hypothetical protein
MTPKGFQEGGLPGEHSYTLALIILFSEMLIFFSEIKFSTGKKNLMEYLRIYHLSKWNS